MLSKGDTHRQWEGVQRRREDESLPHCTVQDCATSYSVHFSLTSSMDTRHAQGG